MRIDEWYEAAYGYLMGYPDRYFSMADVQAYAESKGLPEPPAALAWAKVISRARTEGEVRRSAVWERVEDEEI